MEIQPIAHLYGEFPEKFGIPRQSGLVPELEGRILFEPEFRSLEAVRELDGFSRIWLIWGFSKTAGTWSPTVRPPRLGGNKRVGVFASRSPFRPNALGLSCVTLKTIDWTARDAPVLIVGGADLMSGTPIVDIKPYLPYADAFPDAREGFAPAPAKRLEVKFPDDAANKLTEKQRQALQKVLACDPRPAYQNDPKRMYGLAFDGWQVQFRVAGSVLEVVSLR